MEKLLTYPMPEGVPMRKDFRIRVRLSEGEWQEISSYMAKIDMHEIREASVAYFDFEGKVECEVTSLENDIHSAQIRPAAAGVRFLQEGNVLRFFIERPLKLSIEINGDRFHNLHLFAGCIPPENISAGIMRIAPKDGEVLDLEEAIQNAAWKDGRRVVCLEPGLHRLKEDCCKVPSDTTVIISGGAVVMGSFLVHQKKNVSIVGRGIIYLGHVKKETYLRGADINYSENVILDGVTILNPAHYSVHLGQSKNIRIHDIKAFSCLGWTDGIDMMASENVLIEDVFLRTSDDCIAIYGTRFAYVGDTRNVVVRHAVLWADVAHPTMIGVHGDAKNGGSVLENISFDDIDVLEHHEPQDDYLGCMTINVGDDNAIRNVTYKNVRVEQFERGKLLDIQIKWNKKYNEVPGKQVENVIFENISYTGNGEFPSEIKGFAQDRMVRGVRFKNLTVRGTHVLKQEDGNIHVGEYAEDIIFE